VQKHPAVIQPCLTTPWRGIRPKSNVKKAAEQIAPKL
jgi:hypothetical protein